MSNVSMEKNNSSTAGTQGVSKTNIIGFQNIPLRDFLQDYQSRQIHFQGLYSDFILI